MKSCRSRTAIAPSSGRRSMPSCRAHRCSVNAPLGRRKTGMVSILGIHDLWLFIISGLILNITPGPDTAYIVGRSAQFGWRGGAAATFGIETGVMVHICACAIGLSALLAASAIAFTLVKWVGAAYLCYIGIKMLLTRDSEPAASSAA